MTDPGLRASDADRERVVADLERHTAAGRLTLDEFGERVSRVMAAVTHGDLAAIVSDLPREHVIQQPSRQLAVAFLLAALTLVVLAAILVLGGR